MAMVQAPSGGKRFVGCAKHHCKYDAKGAVKSADRVGQTARMPGNRGGNPRMRELQQQSASGGKKDRGFAVDPPNHRTRLESAAPPPVGGSPHPRQFVLEIGLGYLCRRGGGHSHTTTCNGGRYPQISFATQISPRLR